MEIDFALITQVMNTTPYGQYVRRQRQPIIETYDAANNPNYSKAKTIYMTFQAINVNYAYK